jgi:ATP-binding cassette subfamily B protein
MSSSVPEQANKKKAARVWPVIRNYAKALGKHPVLVAALFTLGFVIELTYIAAPIQLKNLLDALTGLEQSDASATVLFGILGLYALALFVRWTSNQVLSRVSSHLDGRVMSDLTSTAFRYLLNHSHDFFVSNFAGALTRRVNRYASAYEQIFETVTSSFFSTAVYVTGIIIVLSNRSLMLGMGLLLWVIVFILLQIILIRLKQPARLARAEQDTRVTATLSDIVSNHATVSQFAAGGYERSRFAETMEGWRLAALRSWIADTNTNAVLAGINISVQILVLAGTILLWTRGIITIGDFLLIHVYVITLNERVWGMARNTRRLYDAFADAHEMVAILETPHSIKDAPNAPPLAVTEGGIVICDVGFGFTERDVLRDFTLSITPAEKIALVGPSGAGKSTVTKLLLRMYDVASGSIQIDGQDISKVTQESLREAIAFVPQEPLLFHRTLMENIRYGRRDASDEEVIEAAKQARCHGFITQLPQGYDTHVGERGVKLSGGERQRVAIARAILKNAPILVLDEATSSLDSESEALIQEALEALMQGKTVVVIAHRLSTIMHMDRIIVMEQGRIAAEGTHAELLDQHGSLYHKLWSIQAGSFIADLAPRIP